MPGALFGEWTESTAIFGWRMPWRSNAVDDHLPRTSRGLRGVVFIHATSASRPVESMDEALAQARSRLCRRQLEPVFASIDDYIPQIERAVRRIETATGLAPVIVAHSMVGLVARAWLRSRAAHKRSDGTDEAAR